MALKKSIAQVTERYTRVDYAALRARLSKIPTATIIRLYYSDEALDFIECATPLDLEKRLDALRERLAQRLSVTSPNLAPFLADARKFNTWSKSLLNYLVQAAEKKEAEPQIEDPVGLWFRPRFAAALRDGGAHSLLQLKEKIEVAGRGWFKSMPRIGPLKADALVQWLQSNPSLGQLSIPAEHRSPGTITLCRGGALIPLEKVVAIEHDLSGATGVNRNSNFCLISAKNDLSAVESYLYKFRGQVHTHKAYKRELERYVLWCVLERRTAMSSVMTDDCEAYKDFLACIPAHWCGPSAVRRSERWRPFVKQLKPESQRYAIQVIRSFFDWLGKVRYLGGNPWVTVSDPRINEKEVALAIEKALPKDAWDRLTSEGGYLDQVCIGLDCPEDLADLRSDACRRVQFRLSRAAILLMGTSGIRREEASQARRNHLKPVPGSNLWELNILGKRKKWRTVFIPSRTVEAIKKHWADRYQNFDTVDNQALLSPALSSNIPAVKLKHEEAQLKSESAAGFTPMGLHHVVTTALKRLSQSDEINTADQSIFRHVTSHSLRHTFATHAVAKAMPIDVLQKLLGHASSNTTSIYVRAERMRSITEVEKMYGI